MTGEEDGAAFGRLKRIMTMKKVKWMGAAFLLGSVLTGCAAPQKGIIQDQGFLSAAGFRVIHADDAGKRRNLEILPVHRLVTETQMGRPITFTPIRRSAGAFISETRRLTGNTGASPSTVASPIKGRWRPSPISGSPSIGGVGRAGLVAGIIGFCNRARKTDD